MDGRRVSVAPPRWIALHKPPGVLTTKADPQRRRTVYHLLPSDLRALRYVGRLDRGTEGLLLLTNQGDLAQELLLPRNGVEREYQTLVAGIPSSATLRALTQGIELEDGTARARTAFIVHTVGDRATLALVLTEGRKREVRRMLRAVGHPVLRLKRVRFGPVRLGRLPRGQWRDLTETEVAALEDAVAPGPGRSG